MLVSWHLCARSRASIKLDAYRLLMLFYANKEITRLLRVPEILTTSSPEILRSLKSSISIKSALASWR